MRIEHNGVTTRRWGEVKNKISLYLVNVQFNGVFFERTDSKLIIHIMVINELKQSNVIKYFLFPETEKEEQFLTGINKVRCNELTKYGLTKLELIKDKKISLNLKGKEILLRLVGYGINNEV